MSERPAEWSRRGKESCSQIDTHRTISFAQTFISSWSSKCEQSSQTNFTCEEQLMLLASPFFMRNSVISSFGGQKSFYSNRSWSYANVLSSCILRFLRLRARIVSRERKHTPHWLGSCIEWRRSLVEQARDRWRECQMFTTFLSDWKKVDLMLFSWIQCEIG